VTPVITRKKLFQSLVIPHFLYCDVIDSHASVKVNRGLNVAFNSFARYIFGVPRYFFIFRATPGSFLNTRIYNYKEQLI
jgi:hypothetical protein